MFSTRKAALAAGEEWYFTGTPCKHGHICKRRTNNWDCYECEQQKRNFKSHTRHGHAARKVRGGPSGEYSCWCNMIRRCGSTLPEHRPWRDVNVCERWRVFDNFLADMGPRPSKSHSLDRYPDRRGDYKPGNVRWATRIQQARNTTKSRELTYDGKTFTVAEWAERLGISAHTIRVRLHRGKDVAAALRRPQPPST